MPCWSSRPQVRNASHKLRSVTLGFVADGVINKTPFSEYTPEAGIVTPELKCPTTNLTPSPTNLLATETPCFGSDTSSPCSRVSCWPRMPPALLMSSTACCVPLVSWAPKAAFGPVIGPATPNLIWALATPDAARAAANTAPDNQYFFMQLLPSCSGR